MKQTNNTVCKQNLFINYKKMFFDKKDKNKKRLNLLKQDLRERKGCRKLDRKNRDSRLLIGISLKRVSFFPCT